VFSVETQSIAPIAETHTSAAAEPQRLKTLANLQCAIASTVNPRLLQYRAVHHDSERAAETQSVCRSACRSSNSAARGTIKVRSRHTCGCDEPTSSMRVTFTSARRASASPIRRLPSTAATNVHVTIHVDDIACVSKSKSQTLMRNFSTVTQHAHASVAVLSGVRLGRQ
jgi:hypothetical protein